MAASPSTSAWCIFVSSATRLSGRPVDHVISHSGRERSSSRDISRADERGKLVHVAPERARASAHVPVRRRSASSSTHTGFASPQRRVLEPLPVARDQVQPRREPLADAVVVVRGRPRRRAAPRPPCSPGPARRRARRNRRVTGVQPCGSWEPYRRAAALMPIGQVSRVTARRARPERPAPNR